MHDDGDQRFTDSQATDASQHDLGSPEAETEAAVADGEGADPVPDADSASPGADHDAARSGATEGSATDRAAQGDERAPALESGDPENFGGGASD